MKENTIWQILALPPTGDERAIKRAYAKQLKLLDSDDRDAFIALRAAYEAALEEASWRADEAGDEEEENAARVTPGENSGDALYHAIVATLDLDVPAPVMAQAAVREAEGLLPAEDFVAQCWESWQLCTSEDELIARLRAQQAALHEHSIATALDYGDALLQWFYETEKYLPRALAIAAEIGDWQRYRSDFRLEDLHQRYVSFANPHVHSYPALAQWDEDWQQGVWARLRHYLNPLTRGRVAGEFAQFRRDSYGLEGEALPESLRGLLPGGRMSVVSSLWMSCLSLLAFFVFFMLVIPESGLRRVYLLLCAACFCALIFIVLTRFLCKPVGIALGTRGKLLALLVAMLLLATPWLADDVDNALAVLLINLFIMLLLGFYVLLWQWLMTRQAFALLAPASLLVILYAGGFLLLAWFLGESSVQATSDPAPAALLLPLAGALFASTFLRRAALSAQMRCQYASALLHAALMLPLLGFLRDAAMFDPQQGLWRWLVKAYFFTSLIGIYGTPVYRQWHYAVPLLAGLALFVVFIFGAAPLHWLIMLQLGLWLLLPFAILLSPRAPRLGFILPETLRAFAQSIFALCLPLVLWQQGWYGAFAVSIVAVGYILWTDSVIDEAV